MFLHNGAVRFGVVRPTHSCMPLNVRPVMTRKHTFEPSSPFFSHGISVNSRGFLDGARINAGHPFIVEYINNTRKPNAGFVKHNHDEILKDIEQGEEILVEYEQK